MIHEEICTYEVCKLAKEKGFPQDVFGTCEWDGKTDDWDLWRPVYAYIFSDAVAGKISEILGPIDYVDPDTTYQEDVCAYWRAVMEEWRTTKVV